jgi:hypothetical protein
MHSDRGFEGPPLPYGRGSGVSVAALPRSRNHKGAEIQ